MTARNRRRRWQAATIVASASTVFGAPAHADNRAGADVAVYLSLVFGGPRKVAAGLTLEARAYRTDRSIDPCDGFESARFVGGAARVGFLGGQARLVVGAQGGHFLYDQQIAAEVMAGYRVGHLPGPEARVGVDYGTFVYASKAGFDPFRREAGLDLGLRIPPRIEACTIIVGRPRRNEQGVAAAPPLAFLGERREPEARGPLGDALVDVWSRRARSEWASVPAFVQLAVQLRIAGAPASLVARALAAAEDEVRHAVLSAELASRLDGAPAVLDAVGMDGRAPALGAEGLRRLAVESWVDGCLGEGAAAACAHAESIAAVGPRLQSMQRRIASDEARHAELAWDVLAWTIAAGLDRDAVGALAGAAPRQDRVEEDLDLLSWGCLPASSRVELTERVRAQALQRLDRLLSMAEEP